MKKGFNPTKPFVNHFPRIDDYKGHEELAYQKAKRLGGGEFHPCRWMDVLYYQGRLEACINYIKFLEDGGNPKDRNYDFCPSEAETARAFGVKGK